MDYFLIKNGKIAADNGAGTADVLMGNGKILHISSDIARPTARTVVYDAEGRYLIPGTIDCNNHSLSLQETALAEATRTSILSGCTTWLHPVTAANVEAFDAAASGLGTPTPNYGIHFLQDRFKAGDLAKIRRRILELGVPSIVVPFPNYNNFKFERIEMLIEFAVSNNAVLVFDLCPKGAESEYTGQLNKLTQALRFQRCRTAFLNVRYQEELSAVENLSLANDTTCELRFVVDYEDKPQSELHHLTPSMFCHTLKTHKWTFAGTCCLSQAPGRGSSDANSDFVSRNSLAIIYNMLASTQMTVSDLADVTSTRAAQKFGLSPEKGNICVGADADIVVWNAAETQNIYFSPSADYRKTLMLNGKIDAVIMNAQLVLDDKLHEDNIAGRYCYRRIV